MVVKQYSEYFSSMKKTFFLFCCFLLASNLVVLAQKPVYAPEVQLKINKLDTLMKSAMDRQLPDSVLYYEQEALKLLQFNDYGDLASHHHNIMMAYYDLGQLSVSVKEGYQAILYANKFLESTSDTLTAYKQLANIWLDLGFVYYTFNGSDVRKYLTVTHTGLKYAVLANDTGTIVTGHLNLGQGYGKGDRNYSFEKSVYHFTKSLELAKLQGDQDAEAHIYSNISMTYLEGKYYRKALEMQEKALALFSSLEYEMGVMACEMKIGKIYLDYLGQPEKGLSYLLKATSIAQDPIYKPYLIECYRNNSEAYRKLGRYKEAYDARIQLEKLDEAYRGEQVQKEVAELEQKFEAEKKARQIEALLAENKLERERRNAGIGIGIFMLISICVGGLYVNNRKTLRLKQLHTGQLLTTQEMERQRIAKELHDSVGQNILFIRNQLVKEKNETLLGSVDQTLEEVRGISKDLYPNQLEKYGLAAAIEALAEKLKLSTGIFMSSNLDELSLELSSEHKISFYRIIQECVSNTIKHANATAVRVTATVKDKMVELVVQDNGQGFDTGILAEKAHRSFGMLNLEERVKLLQGRFQLESKQGEGTRSVFLIPVS